jgi:hypothetical protein
MRVIHGPEINLTARRVEWATARFPKELGLPHSIHGIGPSRMYHTTGLDKSEILDLCEMVHREAVSPRSGGTG